jgi:hypothetical protein
MYKLAAVSSRPNSRLSTTQKYTSHICHFNIFITCDAADNLYIGLPHRLPVGQLLVRIVNILVGGQAQEVAGSGEQGPEGDESEGQVPLCEPAPEVFVQRQVRHTVTLLLHLESPSEI